MAIQRMISRGKSICAFSCDKSKSAVFCGFAGAHSISDRKSIRVSSQSLYLYKAFYTSIDYEYIYVGFSVCGI